MSNLLSQASLVMIPSGYKEDVVYSEIPLDGSGDLQFTRSSNGTRINSAGLVEVCPWNLFTYSEQPNNADWIGGGNGKPTMTDNFATAPNGTTTASKMEVAGSGYQLRQNRAIENTQMNVSVYLRTNTGTKTIRLMLNDSVAAFLDITVTTTWTRYEVSGLVTTLSGSGRCGLESLEALTSGAHILVWGLQVNIGSTAKPYFPTTDRLNVPRLTYQNGGGGCPSLLLEKQSTNLVTYSEQINSTNYTLNNVTSSENSLTSPDGTINADKIIENTSNSSHSVNRVVALGGTVDNSAYSVSVFAKAEGRSQVLFYDNNQNVGGTTYFNLSTGVVTSGTGKIENFGNGWYRCTIFCLKDLSTTANLQFFLLDSAGNYTYTGNGTSGIGLWGYQVEASSYPTSYIPTTSSSATRVKDECFKTGISSLFGTNQGTFLIDLVYYGSEQFGYLFDVTDSSNANRFLMYDSNGSGLFYFYDSGYAVVDFIQFTKGQRYKIAVKYNSSGTIWYVNGVLKGTGTVSFAHQMSQIYLGIRYSLTDNTGMQVNQTIVFPTALTNAELAQLTA